ncbi:MAG: glycosyltransferase family 4 protein [Bacteroidota bacterium]|nr:glycosyltransferase family 4 protein [Bacteroidota bacterium]
MNILFISIAWPATGDRNLYTDLMDEFVSHGHHVHVVGTLDKSNGEDGVLQEENGITVLRVHSGQIRKIGYLKKASRLLTLGGKLRKAIHEHFRDEQYDLILGPTPPITLSLLYRKLKKHYKAPFYLLLKDIWPQGSVDLKVFRKYSVPWLFFRSHEKRIYKLADYIGTMSLEGAKYILAKNRFLPAAKVEVNPNSIRPGKELSTLPGHEIRDKYGIPRDACVFIFSGNLGVGHGLHFVADAIEALANYPEAYFVIGGSGTQYQYLEKRLAEHSAGNALLYSWLPREDFEQLLATSDVGLIFLYRYTSPQFPSRLLSYLEYSKPVLCAVNKETDIGSIVEEAGCGKSVLHGEHAAFIEAVKFFSEHPEKHRIMGQKGRELLMDNYTVTHSYEIIMNHFRT